jgi:hypothetical protein
MDPDDLALDELDQIDRLDEKGDPAARRFTRWLYHDVLEAIRRYGSSRTPARRGEPVRRSPASEPDCERNECRLLDCGAWQLG